MSNPKAPTLQSGRVVCPECGAKGVGFARHAHAFGYKDYDKAACRYCGSHFAVIYRALAGQFFLGSKIK